MVKWVAIFCSLVGRTMSKMAALPLRLAVGGEVISLVGGEPIGLFVAISGELYEYVAVFTFHGVAPFEFFSTKV